MRSLGDYQKVSDTVLKFAVKNFEFSCRPNLRQILETHPRLVVVMSHSTPLSWIPAPCLLTHFACLEGQGHRRPIGIMDRFFFQYPIIRELAKYISQSDQPMNFEETVAHFSSLEQADLVVFPEGSNCFFGDPNEIQEFRSPRFVEVAIRAQSPLLLCVHKGSEAWAKALPIDMLPAEWIQYLPQFLSSRLLKHGVLTIPLLPKPIEKFQMACELYKPSLQVQQLSEDPDVLRQQIVDEANLIREKMKSMQLSLEKAGRGQSQSQS